MLCCFNALQIFNSVIMPHLIFMVNVMTFGNRAMRRLPHIPMLECAIIGDHVAVGCFEINLHLTKEGFSAHGLIGLGICAGQEGGLHPLFVQGGELGLTLCIANLCGLTRDRRNGRWHFWRASLELTLKRKRGPR